MWRLKVTFSIGFLWSVLSSTGNAVGLRSDAQHRRNVPVYRVARTFNPENSIGSANSPKARPPRSRTFALCGRSKDEGTSSQGNSGPLPVLEGKKHGRADNSLELQRPKHARGVGESGGEQEGRSAVVKPSNPDNSREQERRLPRVRRSRKPSSTE